MMKLIAFGHRKRTGKDTAAKYLITELRTRFPGINIMKVGFADKVKDVAFQLYGWAGLKPGAYYEEPENEHLREVIIERLGKTPRQLWIGIGNGIRAAVGYDGTWLDYAFHAYKCDVLIFKDLRFFPEADGILDNGGHVFRVDCPWAEKATDGADNVLETYTKWTGLIQNDRKDDYRHLHTQVMEKIVNVFFRT